MNLNDLAPTKKPTVFQVLTSPVEQSYEIKKSQFITRLIPAENRGQAMAGLAQAKVDYPDARHHCWAYIFGDPEQAVSMAFNDDGEPAGTAGKPILNVLQHRHLGNCMAVVIRYFGGVKLGAGGLVRAYSTSVQQAVENSALVDVIPTVPIRLSCPYNLEPDLRRFLLGLEAKITQLNYEQAAIVSVDFPYLKFDELESWLGTHYLIELVPAQ